MERAQVFFQLVRALDENLTKLAEDEHVQTGSLSAHQRPSVETVQDWQ